MAWDCLTHKHNFHATCLGLIVGTPSTIIPETSTHLKVTYLGEGGSLNTFPPPSIGLQSGESESVQKLTLVETEPKGSDWTGPVNPWVFWKEQPLKNLSLSHQKRVVTIAAADPILTQGPRQENVSSEETGKQHYTVTFSSLSCPTTLGTLTQANQDSWLRGWREFQA